MKSNYILALDAGTTSNRAILFTSEGKTAASASVPLPQYYPHPGWVEHDPMEILGGILESIRKVLEIAGVKAGEIAGIGITNQRETAVLWDRDTGLPVHPAIVWQCRRTAPMMDKLKSEGAAPYILEKTGLPLDAYFSGSKYRWMLEHIPAGYERAAWGEILAGTVESWLLWKLSGGKSHCSDISNLSRTMLFDIHQLDYDPELLKLLSLPRAMLPAPALSDCILGYFGHFAGLELLEGVPIAGALGDQQASLFGQCCFAPGDTKNTYGTGCFTLMNVGERPVSSSAGLITTVAWKRKGKTSYALEGSVFNGGSTIQWIRDGLGLISSASECDLLAASVPDNGGCYIVPAFTGLGAPYWDMYARGTIVGLTRGVTKAHIARAVLEAIAFQVDDLLTAMQKDVGYPIGRLRVDGGATRSDILMQIQANFSGVTIDRPCETETTALGAAFLAGLNVGLWKEEDLPAMRRTQTVFTPSVGYNALQEKAQWHRAIEKSLGWEKDLAKS